MRACRGEATPRPPLWMMRQAGRYLPEYRQVRQGVSFLDLCKTPRLAAEVTLQPIRRFGFDAAILFSDLLVPLEAMGLEVEFTEQGPRLPNPVRTPADLARVTRFDPTKQTDFVLETIRLVREQLGAETPLIGFAGAPFTVATYAIEGKTAKNFAETKKFFYREPEAARRPAGAARARPRATTCWRRSPRARRRSRSSIRGSAWSRPTTGSATCWSRPRRWSPRCARAACR